MSDENVIDVEASEINVTPGEERRKEFRRALVGGYSRREVEAFRYETAERIKDLKRVIRKLEAEKDALQRKIEAFHDREATLRQALVKAQEYSDNIIEAAKREAQVIRQQAELDRDKLLEEAKHLPEDLQLEIDRMEAQRVRLRNDMYAILETHRRMLDNHGEALRVAEAEEESLHVPEVPGESDAGANNSARKATAGESIVELADMMDEEADS